MAILKALAGTVRNAAGNQLGHRRQQQSTSGSVEPAGRRNREWFCRICGAPNRPSRTSCRLCERNAAGAQA
eukprot:4966152-Prorocentrum_lima.AAC.1